MDFSTNNRYDNSSKENVPPGFEAPAHRSKRRTVLGVLCDAEQHGRPLGQVSKHSSASDGPHLKPLGAPSSSSMDVLVEEAREVVLTASGRPLGSDRSDAGSCPLENEDARFLLDLISGSCPDDSALSEESLTSEEVLCVSEYAEDIYQHMREREARFRPRPRLLENHPEITVEMRAVLVNWMAEVIREYKLLSETLHLSVNYVDRFLSQTARMRRDRLQLAGTAALMIAAKHEEINPPELEEFAYTTDGTYSRKQLIHMEHLILRTLRFRMTAPTTNQFLSLFMAVQPACPLTRNLALYLAELSLLEIDVILQYSPSVLAAAAFSLASYTVSSLLWPDILRTFTGYAARDILPCVADLYRVYVGAESCPHQAVREKFNSSRYCHASSITPPSVLPFS